MKVLIVIPTIDRMVSAETFTSVWRFLRDPAVEIDPRFMMWNKDIVRIRNRALYEFLRTDCTHLWFIDADVGFGPGVAECLFRSGLDFVAGAYPKKRIVWDEAAKFARGDADAQPFEWPFVVHPSSPERDVGGGRFKQAELVPMGCTVLSRKLCEAVVQGVATYGDRYGGEIHQVPAVFNLEMLQQEQGLALLPEDYSFSMHARRRGFEPWVLLDPVCTHTGAHCFDVRAIAGALAPRLPEPT